jgi:hypothetical protein
MEIEKEITVRLTPEEISDIIKDHLRIKGIIADSVRFDIGQHNVDGDWRGEFPPNYELDMVICKGKLQ